MALGLLEPWLAFFLGLVGLAVTRASNATLIQATEAIMIIIASAVLFRMKPTRRFVALSVVAVGGLLVVVGTADVYGTTGGDTAGGSFLVMRWCFWEPRRHFSKLDSGVRSRRRIFISARDLVAAATHRRDGHHTRRHRHQSSASTTIAAREINAYTNSTLAENKPKPKVFDAQPKLIANNRPAMALMLRYNSESKYATMKGMNTQRMIAAVVLFSVG